MAAEADTYQFEPLKAHNWVLWKARISALFSAKELTGYIDGSITKPEETETDALKKWIKEDGEARLLLLTCGTKKLHRTFAKEGDDLAEHIIEVTSARKELHAMGVQIQDRDFIEILMASLPESWDVFTTTYVDAHDSSMKKLTPEDFISAIYKENSRRSTHSRPAMSH
ncbi:hypothetical protein M408DRAFT_331598 [Serendipita vermifera MAFF 305830]|uniref:Retrotransposon Copia-like N-terminal domain-containing protein n=1 Tax=Serendipita vermifera MAFF 305830 TaxID=933852 RepID=A0A0C3AZS7_SERVB|nr:hypothetical protein M408DRAFT_331598 [Serendipita vermifera MAFF 305830]